MSDLGLDEGRSLNECVEIDTGLDAEPVQHVNQILGRKVARCARCIWATAESTGRCIERRNAELERGQHIGQCGPARVVKVQRDCVKRNPVGDDGYHAANPARMGDADRVADRHFERAHVHQRFGDGSDARRWHLA